MDELTVDVESIIKVEEIKEEFEETTLKHEEDGGLSNNFVVDEVPCDGLNPELQIYNEIYDSTFESICKEEKGEIKKTESVFLKEYQEEDSKGEVFDNGEKIMYEEDEIKRPEAIYLKLEEECYGENRDGNTMCEEDPLLFHAEEEPEFQNLSSKDCQIMEHCKKELDSCDYSYGDELKILPVSQMVKEKKKREILSCGHCGKTFQAKWWLKRHMRVHRVDMALNNSVNIPPLVDKEKSAGKRNIISGVDSCYKNVETLSSLYPVKKKVLSCKFCDKIFQSRCELSTHISSHMINKHSSAGTSSYTYDKERTVQKKCTVKDDGASGNVMEMSAVSQHVKRKDEMNKKDALSCKYCGKTFRAKCGLSRHIYVHTVGKHITCAVKASPLVLNKEKSTRKRNTVGNVNFSENTIEVRPLSYLVKKKIGKLSCEFCGMTFVSNRNLSIHMKSHAIGECVKLDTVQIPSLVRDAEKSSEKKNTDSSDNTSLSDCLVRQKMTLGRLCLKEFPHLPMDNDTDRGHELHNSSFHSKKSFESDVALECVPDRKYELKDSCKKYKYKCYVCLMKFTDSYGFSCHTCRISQPKEFKCEVCDANFSDYRKYESHIQMHLPNGLFSCNFCESKFFQRSPFVNHILRLHSKYKPFSCSFCNRSYSFSKDLLLHLRLHSGKHPFNCSYCEKMFNNPEGVVCHMSEHPETKGFYCNFCEKIFLEAVVFAHHMQWHTVNGPFACDVCQEVFTNRLDLIHHKYQHRNVQFDCSDCSKKFTDAVSLVNHNRQHMENNIYRCVCGLKYKGFENFTTHIREHTIKKHYKCSVCCEECTDLLSLAKHLTEHTGKSPKYKCCLCDIKFLSNTELANHKCRLSGHELLQNGVIDKNMIDSTIVDVPLHYYLGNKSYKLNACDTNFTDKEKYINHQNNQLKEIDSTICIKNFPDYGNYVDHKCYPSVKESYDHKVSEEYLHSSEYFTLNFCASNESRVNRQSFSCDSKCSSKIQSPSDNLQKCLICNKTFSEKNHHHQCVYVIQCDICGNRIENSSNSSVPNDSEDSVNLCDACKKRNENEHFVLDHNYAFIGQKAYICDICKKSFEQWESFSKHKMLHLK